MSRRKSRKQRRRNRNYFELAVIMLAVLLGTVAFFLRDFYGIRLRFAGTYIWLLAYIFAFALSLSYFSQYILPVDWKDSWYEGTRLSMLFNLPVISSIGGAFWGKSGGKAATDRVKSTVPISFINHRAGVLPSHYVLALTKGSAFSRAAGPGYVRLKKGEIIAQVVDLRRHLRSTPVTTLTRDGIEVKVNVTVMFQVAQKSDPDDPDRPYPYDDSVIFQVNYLDNFSTGNGVMAWSEHIGRQATDLLVTEIANYSLDELYQENGGGIPPIEIIKHNIERQLRASFERRGVNIILVSVGGVELPEEVTDQRVRFWQSRWHSQMLAAKARGDAAAIREMSLARARAQIEMIEKITEGIETMDQSDGSEVADLIALRMIEAVEEAVANHSVQALLPDNVLKSLEHIDTWMS